MNYLPRLVLNHDPPDLCLPISSLNHIKDASLLDSGFDVTDLLCSAKKAHI
jgi:hypothetical protein